MQAVLFLLNAVVSFFCTLFLLRFMMQALRVSFGGQLGGFVMTLTNWAVKPLRRIIPGIGGFDWASLFAAFMLQLLLAGLLIGVTGRLYQIDYNDSLLDGAAWVSFTNNILGTNGLMRVTQGSVSNNRAYRAGVHLP